MNPYLVLSVSRAADDAQIRRAYLDAIKVATPEADPASFKVLTVAYDQIKDQKSRLQNELFLFSPPGDSPLQTAWSHLRLGARPLPLPLDAFKDYLRSCANP